MDQKLIEFLREKANKDQNQQKNIEISINNSFEGIVFSLNLFGTSFISAFCGDGLFHMAPFWRLALWNLPLPKNSLDNIPDFKEAYQNIKLDLVKLYMDVKIRK